MKKKYQKKIKLIFFFIFSISLGTIIFWPGILSHKSRQCFIKIIRDGSDGKVSMKTILSIKPNYLLRIGKTTNKFKKILLVGDYCFKNYKRNS